MVKVAEPIGNDATGYDVLTAAMKSLLNQFPGLYPDEAIKFEELGRRMALRFPMIPERWYIQKKKIYSGGYIRNAGIPAL